uniref:Uncharacterized protein n=1 Tax=Panagrellus redivivus TaxID=6233 RepID=A0A7E4VHC3_PANRE
MRVNSAVAVLTLVVLVVAVTAKAPKSPYRARLHKNRRIGHGLGREFGTYGGRAAAAVGVGAAAGAGAAIGSQVADEDEFEVDEVDPDEEGTYDDDDDEGGEEYVDDDEYVQSDEEAAREAEMTTVKVKPRLVKITGYCI